MPLSAPSFDLTGRRALVTGSSRGIGLAIARALAGAGAEIVLNGRDVEALGAAADTLAQEGARVKAVAFDVANADSVADGIGWCEAEPGGLDILVNNAAIQHRAPLMEFSADAFERLMAVNLASVFLVGQAAARGMIARGRGRIINICSLLSERARPTVAPYAASKAGVAGLTRGMAVDWARHGLTVNGIAPGYVRTAINAPLVADADFTAWLERHTPMGRWGEVEDLGGAAVFLASDAARFVNGHILHVDGGLSAAL